MARDAALTRGLFFLARFLRHPRTVGALLPSTRSLGDAMVRGLPLAPGDLVLEYGPGTGSLTEAIAELVAATGARYLGIERDPAFHAHLQRRFPHLDFHCGTAEAVREVLDARGLPPLRAILSGLPLILLPTMEQIVATAAAVLQPGGEFRTFSYLQSYPTPAAGRLRRLLRLRFQGFTMGRLVLANFPPAWVMRGTKALVA